MLIVVTTLVLAVLAVRANVRTHVEPVVGQFALVVADKIVKAVVISSVQDAMQVVALPVAPIVLMDVTVDAKVLVVRIVVRGIVRKNALAVTPIAPADAATNVLKPVYQNVTGLVLEL